MGKGSPQVPSEIVAAQTADMNALTSIAQEQEKNSQQLFNLTEPGLGQAENFYQSLATGDPGKIAMAIAPATQQINKATEGSIKNIMQNAPAGGQQNLAIEEAKLNQGAEIGKIASQGYLGSFNALGSLAGQGIGESQGAAGLGLSGLSSAGNIASTMGSQSLQAQQLGMEQKGQTLGALGGLAGDATTLGAAGIGASGAGKAAGAALAFA